MFVWVLALSIIFTILLFAPYYFETTLITRVLYKIVCNPNPYWLIIALSCVGTFTSIYFGDEMMDVVGHHERVQHHKYGFKYKAVVLIGITLLVMSIYYQLISELGIQV